MIAEGQYYGALDSGVTSTARTGNLQLVLEFTITHGPNREPLAASFNKRVYCSLTDKAMPYTRERLEALGFTGDFDNPGFTSDGAWLTCKHETYDGKEHECWELPGSGGEVAKAGATELQRLNAIWRAASEQAAPPPAAPPKADAPF